MKQSPSVRIDDVKKDVLTLSYILAQKHSAQIVSDGLMEGRTGFLHYAPKGSYIAFTASDKKLDEISQAFRLMRRNTTDERIPHDFTTVRTHADSGHPVLFVDLSPLLNEPEALHELAYLMARRNAVKKIVIGGTTSLVGGGLLIDLHFNSDARNEITNIVELGSAAALEYVGGGMIYEAMTEHGVPNADDREKHAVDPHRFEMKLKSQLEEYYKQKYYDIDDSPAGTKAKVQR